MKSAFISASTLCLLALVSVGCEDSEDTLDPEPDPPITEAIEGDAVGLDVISATSTGDFDANVIALVDSDGSLKFISSGLDFDADGLVGQTIIGRVQVQLGEEGEVLTGGTGEDAELRCRWRRIGEGDIDDLYDIGVCLDTTGSMGGAAPVLANRVADFATTLGASGINARFAGLTHGDAFATKLPTGSRFSDGIAVGDVDLDGLPNQPPSFDPDERPGTGTELIDAGGMASFFGEVAEVYPLGVGGGDGEENYLGCLDWMMNSVSWREGAPRILISVGDSCSHMGTTFSWMGEEANLYRPPGFFEAIDLFVGSSTIHVVNHLNWGACSTGYLNMSAAAFATQGTFAPIGDCSTEERCNVDLTSLPILDSIVNSYVVDCEARCAVLGLSGDLTFTFDVEVEDGGETHTAVSEMHLNVAFDDDCR